MEADLRNCRECGRLFVFAGRSVCVECVAKEEEQYKLVRRYVRDNPGASVFEVSRQTGVIEEKILRFLRDGRLESKGFRELFQCERCGTKLSSGRYCNNCRLEIDTHLRSAISSSGKPGDKTPLSRWGSEKMHIKE